MPWVLFIMMFVYPTALGSYSFIAKEEKNYKTDHTIIKKIIVYF